MALVNSRVSIPMILQRHRTFSMHRPVVLSFSSMALDPKPHRKKYWVCSAVSGPFFVPMWSKTNERLWEKVRRFSIDSIVWKNCSGYGFVVFRHMTDAVASIRALHNMPYKGRFLQVRFRVWNPIEVFPFHFSSSVHSYLLLIRDQFALLTIDTTQSILYYWWGIEAHRCRVHFCLSWFSCVQSGFISVRSNRDSTRKLTIRIDWSMKSTKLWQIRLMILVHWWERSYCKPFYVYGNQWLGDLIIFIPILLVTLPNCLSFGDQLWILIANAIRLQMSVAITN